MCGNCNCKSNCGENCKCKTKTKAVSKVNDKNGIIKKDKQNERK